MTTTAPDFDGAEVASVTLWRVRYPLRHAHRAAHGSEAERDLILVAATLGDGTVGWGECSTLEHPTYTGEYTAGAFAVLRDELVPAALEGRTLALAGHPMAEAGLLTALSDALLRRVDRSLATELAAMLGGNPAVAMGVTAVVSRAESVEAVLDDVERRIADRVAMVKLKATPAATDLAAIAAVRRSWPDLALAVDFNGTGDLATLRSLDPLGLRYIEQPAPADELVTSAHFASAIETPIALDESVASPGMLDAAVALGAAAVLNVKPARCGGPHAAATMVGRARNAGLEVFVGGMIESGVGRAAALAVAAAPGCTLPTDLGPSSAYVDHDLTAPLLVDERGRIVTPTGAGIGRVPQPERLAEVVVERVTLGR